MVNQITIEPDEEQFLVCHGDRHTWDFKDPSRGGRLIVHERTVRGKITLLRREVACGNCPTVRVTVYTYPHRDQYGQHQYKYPKGYRSKDHPGRGVILRSEWAHLRTQAMPLDENANGHGHS